MEHRGVFYANVNSDYYMILRIIGMPNFIVVFNLKPFEWGACELRVIRDEVKVIWAI